MTSTQQRRPDPASPEPASPGLFARLGLWSDTHLRWLARTLPDVMVTATGNPELEPVATQARDKLTAALSTLSEVTV